MFQCEFHFFFSFFFSSLSCFFPLPPFIYLSLVRSLLFKAVNGVPIHFSLLESVAIHIYASCCCCSASVLVYNSVKRVLSCYGAEKKKKASSSLLLSLILFLLFLVFFFPLYCRDGGCLVDSRDRQSSIAQCIEST